MKGREATVKRAKKSIFSVGKNPAKHKSRNADYSDRDMSLDIDENEKKDFQMKYYGKLMEEDAPRAGSDVKDNMTFAESTADEKLNENEQIYPPPEEHIDDDMKIVTKGTGPKSVSSNSIVETDKKKMSEPSKKGIFENFTKKRAIIFAISLVAIIGVFFVAVFLSGLFGTSILFNDGSINQDYMTPVDEVSGKINVLVLGVDKEGLRTDTIIVASFNTEDNSVNMLSIPRDTRMYVGSRYQKINAAHAITQSGKIKGPQGSVEAVTRLTGIPINYYVEFSFSAFRDTIDALDGVYFDVPQRMKYSDPVQDLYINLSKGYQLLDGDKAEQLVRFRQYPEGDIKRVRVQQDFIKAVAEQKLNATIITKLPSLYKTLSENIKTNFTLSDMTKYAPYLLKLDLENINMYELPGEYSGDEYSASYWLADMEKVKMLVEETFGYDASKITTGKSGTSYLDDLKNGGKDNSPTNSPSSTPKASSTAETSSTPKQTEKVDDVNETSRPSATANATQSPKPTQSSSPEPTVDNDSEETNASVYPSYGSSSADGIINATVSGTEISEVHTPPATSAGDESLSTPTPITPSTSAPVQTPAPTPTTDNSSNGGFVRPGVN